MPEPPANWNSFFECASQTDIGLRRTNNQDSLIVVEASSELEWCRRGHMFIVADGMGAHAAGEMASKLACAGIPHTYFKLPDLSGPEALRRAVIETNADIHARGRANVEFQGMGTTLSVLTLLPQGAVTAQVGDSRVYRWRKHRLEQLTFDHSLVWEMMAGGQLPEGDNAAFIPKNIITRSLGPHAEVKVDLEGPFPLEVGDTFLICSDGLSGQVSNEELGVLMGALPPAEAARTLVDLANLRGGPDNISVVIVRIKEPIHISDARLPDRAAAGSRPAASAPLAVWIAASFLALAAGGAALSEQLAVAAVCGAGALLSAGFGLVKTFAGGSASSGDWATHRLGKGPHTTTPCQPTAAAVAPLAQLCDKLRTAALEDKYPVDWAPFNTAYQAATAALAASKFTVAVREFGHAMSFLMEQIQRQRRKRSERSDSALDP